MVKALHRSALLVLSLALAACAPASSPADSATRFDPLAMDPPANAEHPPSMTGLRLPSNGVLLNGVIYVAAGAGPHPTLLMLHGYPGAELNLDIAQAARRAGWNTLWFHYRGTWGSPGEFSLAHVLEDAGAVFDALRAPDFAREHRIDPARVTVFGHSMGGFAALETGAAKQEARCTVALAGANFGGLGAMLADPKLVPRLAAIFQQWGEGPIAGLSGARLVDELIAHREDYDLNRAAPALAARPLLLVAANQDTIVPPAQNHEPLLAALRAAGSTRVQELRLDTDHGFAGQRIALARGVLAFLDRNCL